MWPNFLPKSRFGLSFGSVLSNVDKNCHKKAAWPWEQASNRFFSQNLQILPRMETSKIKIWPYFAPKSRFHLSFVSGKSDVHKIGTIKRLDPTNNLVKAFLKISKNLHLPVGVKGQVWRKILYKISFLHSNSKSVGSTQVTYGHALYPYNVFYIFIISEFKMATKFNIAAILRW